MDIERKIKKDLKLIKKKGDLYDVISQKRNATPDTFLRKTIKAHTIIFSRILYLFLVCSRRVKNSFAPVEKIRKAQEEIRKYVGLPIDMFKTKDIYVSEKYKTLGILYGDYHAALNEKSIRPSIENLIKDLKSIADFCSKYEINEIYVDEFFLRRYLSVEFLDNFKHIYHSEMMDHSDSDARSFLNIKVTFKQLNDIIIKLEENKFDNEYIYAFKEKINDQIVKKAIDTFKYNNNANELLRIVKSRLNMHINDEGIVKDRVYGKMYESYEIGGPYLRISVTDSQGNFISRNIINLYNYLEVKDFSSLEVRANTVTDNQEINQIALLYLYLLGEKPKEEMGSEEIYSIYDYIYNKYKTTKSNKKIPWIKTKLQKIDAEIPQFVVAFFSVLFGLFSILLAKFIPNHLPINHSFLNKYNNFFDNIKSTYEESYEMEQNLLGRLKQTIEKFLPKKVTEEILDYTQDEMDINQGKVPKKVAEIEWFTEERKPLYFMNQYANYTYFYHGELDFHLRDNDVIFSHLVDCAPLFQIKVPLLKSEFEAIDEDSRFYLPLEVCPVGDAYALSKVIIKDEMDQTKYIIIDEGWYHQNLWDLTQEEKEIFKSIESPMAYYVYGLRENASQFSVEDRDYTKEITEEEAKEAIIRGLGLDEFATSEEINGAIASKGYTKYPLYTPTFDTDELEYYEEIASLDNIDINLAAILTTMANEGFVYTVGYKNANEDNYILTDEAYVWAMNDDGEIIDFLANFTEEESSLPNEKSSNENDANEWNNEKRNTNNKNMNTNTSNTEKNKKEWISEKEESKIKEVLNKIRLWAKKYHIPYYVAAILGVLIIEKIFGRKIQLKLKFKNAYKILNDENLASTYAELFYFIYGEESVPIKRSANEMIELISKQFQAIDEDKINDLLVELKVVIKESDNQKSFREVKELLQIIPFIVERKDELKRTLQKRFVPKK